MAAPRVFFSSSRVALTAVTELFDFVWPTAAALWNLRWQVRGYDAVRGGATVPELHARFIEGSGIHGTNLHVACLNTTWEQQTSELAKFTLTNLFALYEAWLDDLLQEVAPALSSSARGALAKALQFPTNPKTGKGVTSALKDLTAVECVATRHEIYPRMAKHPLVNSASLESLLVVYRYFKECRNSFIHRAGRADQKVIDAHAALAPLSGLALPFAMPPTVSPTLGTMVQVTLFSVVGFQDLLRRLIITLDAELVRANGAERVLVEGWRTRHGAKVLKAAPNARGKQISHLVGKLGIHPPTATLELEKSLRAAKLILL